MAGRERTLSQRELNRSLLARQLLLERARLPLPRTLERMGGLQAQYAPSMYVGLWSRVEGFRRGVLTHALERREVVQATLMRVTIHLVSAEDYWPLAVAVRAARRTYWLRAMRGEATAADLEEAAEQLRHRLLEGPIRRSELDQLVGKSRSIGVGLWVDLVRAPPSGTWERRRADLFASAESWLGPPAVTPEEADELLVRRYLTGFGPSTAAELADWAGLPTGEVAPVLERLPLRRFRAEDGPVLFDLPRSPLPDAATPAPVRFLPTWDAILLVHARRKAILPEAYRPLVFSTKNPHSVSTFLVDGAVAGTWKYEEGRVRLEPFEPLPSSVRRGLEDEAERLAAFHS
ncbi:MAG: winged helix DNA-binding domain-containing protein [Actinobacteria bacterium]|nr:winged helix DNA-binding domain-containing protein [Actinomycetota bacterium]